jgi:hypothetical protein
LRVWGDGMELRLKGIELEWGRDIEFHFMEESESTKDFEVRIKNKKIIKIILM